MAQYILGQPKACLPLVAAGAPGQHVVGDLQAEVAVIWARMAPGIASPRPVWRTPPLRAVGPNLFAPTILWCSQLPPLKLRGQLVRQAVGACLGCYQQRLAQPPDVLERFKRVNCRIHCDLAVLTHHMTSLPDSRAASRKIGGLVQTHCLLEHGYVPTYLLYSASWTCDMWKGS